MSATPHEMRLALNRLLEVSGVSDGAVARALGISRSSVRKFMGGETPCPGWLDRLPGALSYDSAEAMVEHARTLPDFAIDTVKLGDAVRKLREAGGLTREELCKRGEISVRTLGTIERGEHVHRQTLALLPAMLGCDYLQQIIDKAEALPVETAVSVKPDPRVTTPATCQLMDLPQRAAACANKLRSRAKRPPAMQHADDQDTIDDALDLTELERLMTPSGRQRPG